MKFLLSNLLIFNIHCYYLNKTDAVIEVSDDSVVEALIDHECRECAHNFNDGGVEKGRMVTVMPFIHPVYMISLEYYVWAINGQSSYGWDNIFHFTKADDADGSDCTHRTAALFVKQNENDDRKITNHISACVNGKEKVLNPIVTKDQWHSLEFGQYNKRMEATDVTHHYYIKLDGQIIYEEQNFDPITFQDVKVYMSDPWWPAAYGLIRKFKYRKYDEFCLYYCP